MSTESAPTGLPGLVRRAEALDPPEWAETLPDSDGAGRCDYCGIADHWACAFIDNNDRCCCGRPT